MKLLLDTCVWGGAAHHLERAGHDVVWAGSWPEDPGDAEILATASRDRRILSRLDKDFGELAVVYRQPHAGILRIVGSSAREQCPLCQRILSEYGDVLASGALATVGVTPSEDPASRFMSRERWSSDERILGSSEFVEQVWVEAERQGLERPRHPGGYVADLIDRVAAQFGVTPAELCGGTRRRPVVAARRCVAWLAVRQYGGSPTAVARALGVSRSTVLRGLAQKPEGVDEVLGREQG